MLFSYIIKNMRRSALTNALFCMLLVLAGALLALSAGLWYSTWTSERELEDIITTIAVPDRYAVRAYADDYVVRNNLTEFETPEGRLLTFDMYGDNLRYRVSPYIQYEVMNTISEKVFRSGKFETDDRRVYGAYVPGLASVPIRQTENPATGTLIEYSPQSIAAFVVSCGKVEEVYEISWQRVSERLEISLTRALLANFTVEEDVLLHEGRQRVSNVTAYFPCMNPDGSLPVREGGRYLLVGSNFSQVSGAPNWYESRDVLPPDKRLYNALQMSLPSGEPGAQVIAVATGFAELDNSIVPWLTRGGVTALDFPIEIMARIPEHIAELGYEGQTWFELEGSLDDALQSEQGEAIATALRFAEISCNSLQVLTTNDLNSILRFNQRTHRITEGRAFTENEYLSGARMCVISEQLAELNGLTVGDTLPLQLFPSALNQLSNRNDNAWPWSPYDPTLDITDPIEFEIVGIYLSLTQEMRDHAVSPSTVIIPASSFPDDGELHAGVFTGKFDPPLLDTIIVPNDKVSETQEALNDAAGDYSLLFRFYDQGYSALKPILSNLRYGMSWIMALSAVGWAIAVVMFALFYIGRKRNEMMLLSAIGVSKMRCMLWVAIQCAIVVFVAQCFVIGLTLPLFDRILDAAIQASREFTEAYRNLTLSELNESGGLRIMLPFNRTTRGLLTVALGQALALLTLTLSLTIRAAGRASLLGRRSE